MMLKLSVKTCPTKTTESRKLVWSVTLTCIWQKQVFSMTKVIQQQQQPCMTKDDPGSSSYLLWPRAALEQDDGLLTVNQLSHFGLLLLPFPPPKVPLLSGPLSHGKLSPLFKPNVLSSRNTHIPSKKQSLLAL